MTFLSTHFPSELQAVVFSIVRELLLNACHHSKSKNVLVGVAQDEERVSIQVQDWGIGFDVEMIQPHKRGLKGIQQAARWLGGTVDIDNRPGDRDVHCRRDSASTGRCAKRPSTENRGKGRASRLTFLFSGCNRFLAANTSNAFVYAGCASDFAEKEICDNERSARASLPRTPSRKQDPAEALAARQGRTATASCDSAFERAPCPTGISPRARAIIATARTFGALG